MLLSACVPALTAEIRVIVRQGEAWEFHAEIVLLPEQAQLIASNVSTTLDQTIQELTAKGVEASWTTKTQQDNNVAYTLVGKGTGLAKLNDAIFGGAEVFRIDEATQDGRILFRLTSGSSVMVNAQQQVFVLEAGQIISTNGDQNDGRAVTWINPRGTLEAVVLPAPNWPVWLPYLLIIVGILCLGGAVIGYRTASRRRPAGTTWIGQPQPVVAPVNPPQPRPIAPPTERPWPQPLSSPDPQPTSSAPAPAVATFCPQCGTALPVSAAFCPTCGRPR